LSFHVDGCWNKNNEGFIMYQFKSITDIRSHKTFSTLNQADSDTRHFKRLHSIPSFNRPQGLSTQAYQLDIFNNFCR